MSTISRIKKLTLGRLGLIEGAAMILFGLFLAVIAPFGTASLSEGLRHLYWQMALLGGGVIAALIEMFLSRLLTQRPRLFLFTQLAAMTVAIAVWVGLLPTFVLGYPVSAERIFQVLPDVLSINVAVMVLAWLTHKAFRRGTEPQVASDGFVPQAIRCKLPPRLARARLVAVEAEDHYLRIRTDAGSALVAMRLGDALEHLAGSDGFQCHRSWWVARRAVQDVRWRAGRGALALSDGSSAPVSRSYAAALKTADWSGLG